MKSNLMGSGEKQLERGGTKWRLEPRKRHPIIWKNFIALGIGIAFGYVLNMMGGTHNPIINGYILPFLQFLGDFFIKLIKMVVVPLVFSVSWMQRCLWAISIN